MIAKPIRHFVEICRVVGLALAWSTCVKNAHKKSLKGIHLFRSHRCSIFLPCSIRVVTFLLVGVWWYDVVCVFVFSMIFLDL